MPYEKLNVMVHELLARATCVMSYERLNVMVHEQESWAALAQTLQLLAYGLVKHILMRSCINNAHSVWWVSIDAG
jgi:hypothetical protein